MSMIECVIMVALMAAFAVLLIKKWGIAEYFQVHGNKFFSQLFSCDLCMSFWTCLVLSLALVIVNSDPWMIITAIPATPVTRMLV